MGLAWPLPDAPTTCSKVFVGSSYKVTCNMGGRQQPTASMNGYGCEAEP